MDNNNIICIVGPTASGKSELAQCIAQKLHGEIISADSMQIYRGMDIGTGKVLPQQRSVSHYGLDIVNPGEPYSASLFQTYARNCFEDMFKRGVQPILCGGTGFYIRAAIDDYQFPSGDQVDNPIREKYQNLLALNGEQYIWNLLLKLDSKSAELIHPNNSRRVIRALELYENGESYATQKLNLAQIKQTYPACFIGLQIAPELLKERINQRVDTMIEAGLVDEVKTLLSQGFREGLTSQQAIGYKEIVAALDGEQDLPYAIEQIKTATRRYAKRQRSWFKHDQRVHWVPADEGITSDVVQQALAIIDSCCTS